jgi:hypothetical protein
MFIVVDRSVRLLHYMFHSISFGRLHRLYTADRQCQTAFRCLFFLTTTPHFKSLFVLKEFLSSSGADIRDRLQYIQRFEEYQASYSLPQSI